MSSSVLTQIILAVILLGSGRHNAPTDHVDLVEVNHYESGGHGYDQTIFYEWSEDYRRYHVVGWFLAEQLEHYPTQTSDGYVCYRINVKKEYVIHAKHYRETWTDFDPERLNKKVFDEERRRGLKGRDRK